MLLAVHQPEHLPWAGFLAKLAAADRFVVLDCVPFRKNYFQNRNRILGAYGRPAWLTVPVRRTGNAAGRIADVAIAEDAGRWRRKWLGSLRQRYGRHPGFADTFPALERIVAAGQGSLAKLNLSLIDALASGLGIHTPWVRASELGAAGTRSELGAAGTRSELLVDLCRRVGADAYLSGPSGRDYLDFSPFDTAGITVLFHDYEHPVYAQRDVEGFVSHLSVVDALFNLGPDAGDVVRSGSRISRTNIARPGGDGGSPAA